MPLDPDRVAACLAVLEAVRLDGADPLALAVERAAAQLYRSRKKSRRRERQIATIASDHALAAESIRAANYHGRALAAGPRIEERVLQRSRRCYVCKQPFRRLHAFYQALCPACAERNFAARTATADLAGRRAIVTGGRIKIGYEVAQALARAGARVTITTRFPDDAARRLDPAIEVVGIDFRDLRGVLAWIDTLLARDEPLDILVNNAAQTIRRDRRLLAAEASQLVDETGEVLDLAATNSWTLRAHEVPPIEVVEVHVINAIVPYLLASRLRPLFVRSAHPDRYVINVTAMEGVFAYANKRSTHPHTNMAKAALNMFTRTSAEDYARDGIYMASVDTGWITQENPGERRARAEASGFVPPLDIVDGAARVLDPIFRGVAGAPAAGVLLKDFEPAPW